MSDSNFIAIAIMSVLFTLPVESKEKAVIYSESGDVKHFNFAEHFSSIDWIDELPVPPMVDLNYEVVNINISKEGTTIYIGPIDSYTGGDAITIELTKEHQLKAYVMERLEPVPKKNEVK